ncbi:hypothetical protein T10_4481 [Trichinella papuae]|uniref:Uncharacterized protein n=1 Tax=Trichinella papuae TaxID=268474 RepID=A0A0V1LWY7_9BILA|nr:hypothetical protein T10_4481 [Trichinella papuae]
MCLMSSCKGIGIWLEIASTRYELRNASKNG